MSELSTVFDELSREIIPQIFEIVLPHTLRIKRTSAESDGGGGQISTEFYMQVGSSDLVLNCHYEAKTERIQKVLSNGQVQHFSAYEVILQRYLNDGIVDIQPSDRLEISDFGTEVSITHHIEAIKNESGVYLKIVTRTE